MSYFSIKNFIEAGEKAIEDKNYLGALSIALALPSMCSRIEFENDKDAYMNFEWTDKGTENERKTYTTWKDKKCYVDFCNQTMRTGKNFYGQEGEADGYLVAVLGEKFAEALYQLRCDIIHAGITDVFNEGKNVYLAYGETSVTLSKCEIISINYLCFTIFDYISSWCANKGIDNLRYTRVFDVYNNEDDRLLYEKLCEDDRKEYLKNEFEKENALREINHANN